MKPTSTAFAEGQPIPKKYTCEGQDLSPGLKWGDVPAGTKSLALLVDDPDAPNGTWSHWVVVGIPPETREIPEGGPLPWGSREGTNDFKRTGWGGPCPPPGHAHRYYFRLYALDTTLDGLSQPSRAQLLSAVEGHTLEKGELMGTYQKA
jgi:Raf kinase inhibitor-like YbhB/YbcL family protein